MVHTNKPETMTFEDNNFVKECLDAFDANVAQIEKDYAVTPNGEDI